MSKKDIIGYILLVLVIIMVMKKFNFIDTTNYTDYELSENQLSKAKPIKLESSNTPYCAGDDGYDPGFYDIKALGGSINNSKYSNISELNVKENDYLNDMYISDDECLLVDGNIELIPTKPSSIKYDDEFIIEETTDLIVGENIDSGTYKIKADIPDGTSVFISTNNNNKISEENYFVYIVNNPGFDNSQYKDVTFNAYEGDVISIQLQKIKSNEVASFPVYIKRIKNR